MLCGVNMENNLKKWHWIFNDMEFRFADDKFPFAIVRFVHDSNGNLPMHKHGFIEFVLVLDGCAKHKIHIPKVGEYECTIKKGDTFIINPEEEHTYFIEEGQSLDILNINFYSDFLDGTLIQGNREVKLMDFVYQQPLLPIHARFGNMLRLNEEEIFLTVSYVNNILRELKEKDMGYIQVISLHMTLIFTMLSRKYNSLVTENAGKFNDSLNGMSDIFRVIGYLEHHHSDDISKEQLAKIACSGVRNLSRKFKECTGETVFEYIHKLRISKAKKLLLETDMRIIEISSSVGFNDISFFNKVFKKEMGMTPREFRACNNIKEA